MNDDEVPEPKALPVLPYLHPSKLPDLNDTTHFPRGRGEPCVHGDYALIYYRVEEHEANEAHPRRTAIMRMQALVNTN